VGVGVGDGVLVGVGDGTGVGEETGVGAFATAVKVGLGVRVGGIFVGFEPELQAASGTAFVATSNRMAPRRRKRDLFVPSDTFIMSLVNLRVLHCAPL